MPMHPSQDHAREPYGQTVIVDAAGLPALFEALRGRGYTVVGPTVRDGAIVVAGLASAAELPFGHSAGPQSWKTVLPRSHRGPHVTRRHNSRAADKSWSRCGVGTAPSIIFWTSR